MRNTGRFLCAALALLAVVPCRQGQAQLGGLIKKKAAQAAAGQVPAVATGPAPTFDNVILELTSARIDRVIAGKTAGRKLATGPNSPAALRKKLEAVDEQQAKIYSKHVDDINGWDEQRRNAETCRDSALSEAHDRRNQESSMASDKMRQLALDVARAQARGDSAEVRRLMKEVDAAGKPTAADSAQATRACPVSPAPAVVQQWMGLKQQIDQLNDEIAKAEAAIKQAEQTASGLDDRQLAMACERAKMLLEAIKSGKPIKGFTQPEIDAVEQKTKEIDALCL